MYISRTHNHISFSTLFFFLALVGGVALSFVIPIDLINPIFPTISNFTFQFMLYFTIPYLLFSLLISTYELNRNRQFLSLVKHVAKMGIIIMTIVLFVSILIFIFIPNQNIISLVSKQRAIPPISVAQIVSNVFSLNWSNTQYASQVIIVPFFILAIILGLTAAKTIEARHPLLETCNALRSIYLKILEKIFPWYAFAVIIMTIRNISGIRSFVNLANFLPLLLYLAALALLLAFAVYPFLLKKIGVSIHYKTWCKQIIPAIATAFAGGNMTTASISLLYVEDINNSRHKITDNSIALSFIFARVGTCVTIACAYLLITKTFTAIPLSLIQLAIIFVFSIFFSYLSNAVSIPIILSGIATLSQIQIITVHNLYLAILPLSIILHSLATVIDIVTCGFIKLYVAHKLVQNPMSSLGIS